MKKMWAFVMGLMMVFSVAVVTPALANESYDQGYQQGYTDAGNNLNQPIHDADEDYLAGYDAGQEKWHAEHDKTLAQRYNDAKDAVQTAEKAVDTAKDVKTTLDNWEQHQ